MITLPTWRLPDRRDDDLVDTVAIEIQRGPRAGTWIHVAPWGRRAAAATVDGLPGVVLVVAAAVHLRVTMEPEGAALVASERGWVGLAVALVAALVFWVLNEGVLQSRNGQSLGKRLFGLRLVDTTDGEPLRGFAALEWSAHHDMWVSRTWMTTSDKAVLSDTAVVLAD